MDGDGKVHAVDFFRLGMMLAMLRRTSGKPDAVFAGSQCPQCGAILLRQPGTGGNGAKVSCTNCMYDVTYPADTDD